MKCEFRIKLGNNWAKEKQIKRMFFSLLYADDHLPVWRFPPVVIYSQSSLFWKYFLFFLASLSHISHLNSVALNIWTGRHCIGNNKISTFRAVKMNLGPAHATTRKCSKCIPSCNHKMTWYFILGRKCWTPKKTHTHTQQQPLAQTNLWCILIRMKNECVNNDNVTK